MGFNRKPFAEKKCLNDGGRGDIHLLANYNNTFCTITDRDGNTILWLSAGIVGFKGAKKRTSWAARTITSRLVKKASRGVVKNATGRKSSSPHLLRGAARWLGPPLKFAMVWLSGPGYGRYSSLRAVLHVSIHRRRTWQQKRGNKWGGRASKWRGKTLKKGLRILAIRDVTPIPWNGCRPKKRRRKRIRRRR
jgi:small subunit ribosomal protein S11